MRRVAKSVTPLKKHQQAAPNAISIFSSLKAEKWCLLAPFFLLIFSYSTSSKAAQNLNNQLINSSAIVQDPKGFIWLATPNGLIRHDSENNITFNSNNKNWPLAFNWINDIHLIDDNHLLLATETHKLWLFDINKGSAKPLPVSIHRNSIYNVIVHKKKYYLNVPNTLYKVEPTKAETKIIAENISIKHLHHTDKNVYVSTTTGVFRIVDDKLVTIERGKISAMSAQGSTLIFAMGNKLTVLPDSGDKQSIPVNTPVASLTHSNDKQSAYAIDKAGNINQYLLSSLKSIPHNYPNIKPVFIEKLFHDSTGVLWVLSNHGVKQVIPSTTKNNAKIFDVAINAIALTAHQEQLILGSYGGGLGTLTNNDNLIAPNINQSFSAEGKIVTDLYSNGDSIFISTFDGLWRYNTKNKELFRVDFPNNSELLLNIKYKDGALYLASNTNGVIKYHIKNNQVEYHIKGSQLSSSEAIDSLPLPDNKLWVATPKGIDIVDIKAQTVRKIADFGENKVISLLEYKNKVFVTTKGDGFFVFNFHGELLSHFAKNISFGYMTFIEGEIWISGRPGLYRLNPDTYQLKMVANTEQYTFTKKPVLLNNKVYVGHYGGVVEVPLAAEATLHANIYISKTIASGKAQLLNSTVEIDSPNDVVTLELASLDFRPGQNKQFKYQLNDGQWHDINGSQLTLTGLSSGHYHLEIMGTNSLGQWSDFKAYADIHVAYPWYWHPSARVIYFVLIIMTILLTAWLLYLRTRSISHIHQLLNDEIKTHGKSASIVRRKLKKVQELMSVGSHHPALKKEDSASLNWQEANILLNECLTELKVDHNHAEPSKLSGSSLTVALPYLADYFHQQYHVLVSVQLDIESEKIDYAIQTAIYRIIYEAILAAINNGNGGVFAIHVNESNEKIWLKITDNEQSFSQFNSKINFDMAMYYIRQVANKFNATFHTYDNQEHGSEIIISIPLMSISTT